MSPARSVWMLGGPAVLAAAVAKYRRDLRRDHEQLAAFEREVIDTPFGRVEYAQAGEGPPVLVGVASSSHWLRRRVVGHARRERGANLCLPDQTLERR